MHTNISELKFKFTNTEYTNTVHLTSGLMFKYCIVSNCGPLSNCSPLFLNLEVYYDVLKINIFLI